MHKKGKIALAVLLAVAAMSGVGEAPALTTQASQEEIDITNDEKLEILGVEDVTYTGKNIVQNLKVKYNGDTLRENTDYYCLYSNNLNAGTASIRIVGRGNYTGYQQVTFQIFKAVPDCSITNGITGTYGDTIGDIELPKRDNGVFTWNEDLSEFTGEPGSHNYSLKFTPNDTDNYEIVDNILVTVEIFQKNISEAFITGIEDAVYCEQAIVYEPVLTINGTVLEKDKDYTIEFSNNTNAGTAMVLMKGINHYTGSVQENFTIKKADPDYGEIGILNAVYRDCLGDIQLPQRDNGSFIWEYNQSMSVGTVGTNTSYAVRFVPDDKSNYNTIRNIPVEIKVEKKDISLVSFSDMKAKTYTGEEQTQNLYVKDGEVKLVKDKDYIVTYENNVNAGVAKVTIKGVDNYKGQQQMEFNIEKAVPEYPKLSTLNATYKDTLSQIELPEDENGTFTFMEDKDTLVGEVGVNTFYVKYEPKDTGNYRTVENIPVIVKVQPLDLSTATILGVEDGYATGREVKPKVTVEFQGKILVAGEDYTVGYANNIYPGKAAVVVKGMGNYTGKIVQFYQVLEK